MSNPPKGYAMAYFKACELCSGMFLNQRIVMAYFKTGNFVVAYIKFTLDP